jgi:hypothetical protein
VVTQAGWFRRSVVSPYGSAKDRDGVQVRPLGRSSIWAKLWNGIKHCDAPLVAMLVILQLTLVDTNSIIMVMAFVTKKGDYYQLVESRRVNGRPRQVVLCYLGTSPTVEAAYQYWRKQAYGKLTYGDDNVLTIAGVRIHGDPNIHQMRAKQKVEVLEQYRDKAVKEADEAAAALQAAQDEERRRTAKIREDALQQGPLNCGFWREAVETLGIALPTTEAANNILAPTVEEFKSAYRDAVKKLNADMNGRKTDADTRLKLSRVKAAFEYVVDWSPAKRNTDWMTPEERWATRRVWQTTDAKS